MFKVSLIVSLVLTLLPIFPVSGKEVLCSHIPFSKDGKVWPIDIYKHFLTDEIINLIVVETNRYAAPKKKENHEKLPSLFQED